MKRRERHYWRNIIIVSLVALLIGLFLTFYLALPIIYANGIAKPKRAPVCCVTPEDWGLQYEDVSFQTNDGITLKGWYIPSRNGAAVIVSHSIGGNRVGHLEKGVYLAENGFGVLLLDLRAHGESQGNMVTFDGADIIAALDYLQTRDEIDPQKIGVLGISLGGLASIQAAAVRQDIKVVVAEGAAANKIWDFPRPPTLGHWFDLPFQVVTYWVLDNKGVTAPISTVDAIGKISPRPIMLISGAGSEYERAIQQKFYESARGSTILWEVPDAEHAEAWQKCPGEYKERIMLLFKQALLAGK